MNGKIKMVVIYNHNYERNIDVIKRLYAGRFSNVCQVMPFYRGVDSNVIGVYENSYQYSGYVTQAASRFRSHEYSYYVFVADDMVLNPRINETNILDVLKLDKFTAFHPGFTLMTDEWFVRWPWGAPSVYNIQCCSNACEWRNFMPSIDEARRIFAAKGLDCGKMVSVDTIAKLTPRMKTNLYNPYKIYSDDPTESLLKAVVPNTKSKPVYPMARGFSDFFVVPACAMDDFCHYCGVFAAMRMFVETAIPTSLVLSCPGLHTLHHTGMKAENGVSNNDLRKIIAARYDSNYARLVSEWPDDMLYIHPIKLSQWKDLP